MHFLLSASPAKSTFQVTSSKLNMNSKIDLNTFNFIRPNKKRLFQPEKMLATILLFAFLFQVLAFQSLTASRQAVRVSDIKMISHGIGFNRVCIEYF
jgi:hypothetical protein